MWGHGLFVWVQNFVRENCDVIASGLGLRESYARKGEGSWGATHPFIVQEQLLVLGLQGVADARHLVRGREVLHLWEDLALPVNPVAHPAIEGTESPRS